VDDRSPRRKTGVFYLPENITYYVPVNLSGKT
jgi:hypothetical protein